MRSTLAGIVAVCLASPVLSQTTQERGADGQMYNVTRTTIPKTVLTTEMQTQESTVYRPQVTTQYQAYQQTVMTPVTEYRWVSRQHGWWNPFREPYWAHSVEPVTRWEYRPATVQVPVSSTNWVAEKRTTQVPVASYKTVNDTYVSRVPVGPAPAFASSTSPSNAGPATSTPQVASRPQSIGGTRLDTPNKWQNRY